jgi:hypothetical protein
MVAHTLAGTGELEQAYTPAQVGERLQLKAGMVRRYGIAYEAVTGEQLSPEPNAPRVYPEHVVRVLEQTREIVKDNPGLSAEQAIREVLEVPTVATAPSRPSPAMTQEQAAAIIKALQALREEVAQLREENRALENKLDRALPAPPETPKRHGLLGWLRRSG